MGVLWCSKCTFFPAQGHRAQGNSLLFCSQDWGFPRRAIFIKFSILVIISHSANLLYELNYTLATISPQAWRTIDIGLDQRQWVSVRDNPLAFALRGDLQGSSRSLYRSTPSLSQLGHCKAAEGVLEVPFLLKFLSGTRP